MNIADLVIILLVLAAILRGLEVGLLQLVFFLFGFAIGLLFGSWLASIITAHFTSSLSKLLVILLIELVSAFLLAAIAQTLSFVVEKYVRRMKLGKANRLLGAVVSAAFTLLVCWLLAAGLAGINLYGIGRQIRTSAIIRTLDSALPPAPAVFTRLENIISPNGFPNVFIGLEPQHTTVSPTNSISNKAILAAEKSVVQVRGTGCGGIVFGSGFVVANHLVVTNAHVVAGIRTPMVLDGQGTYSATPVWFDPNLDVAILRVDSLNDPPLKLHDSVLPDRYAVATLGYPGGGPLVATRAVVIDHVTAEGRNIYNQNVVLRNIYEVQGNIAAGDSGGPLLAPDGSVAGVNFARSVTQSNIGYSLLINQLDQAINSAKTNYSAVSTGGCTQ